MRSAHDEARIDKEKSGDNYSLLSSCVSSVSSAVHMKVI
jgi:hypothetical protein